MTIALKTPPKGGQWFKAAGLVASAERGCSRGQTKAFWRQPKDDGFQRAKIENRAGYGKVVEWFKAPVLKTGVGSPPPRVRIPPFPPVKKFPAMGTFFHFFLDTTKKRV